MTGAIFALGAAFAGEFSEGDHRGWPVYGGDFAGAKYSALVQIDRSNVHQLAPAWTFRTGDMRERPATTIECNPIVRDGVLYLTSPSLRVMALEAATGTERWRFDPWEKEAGRGVNRGVTFWERIEDGTGAESVRAPSGDEDPPARVFFVAGPFLYALDAKTGALIPGFGEAGHVDLRDGLDRDVYFLSVTATSPGIVYRDLLILGSVVGEGPNPSAPGHIRAFDVRTGERRWIFHTIPHPGEYGYRSWPTNAWETVGGANCWGGFTLDADRGWVFAGTGSPAYDHYGANRIGSNLFGNCVLALDAATGERLWHFQVVHHDLWDYDIPCPPNLVTVSRGGHLIDAVAQATKMGYLFLLDRETGTPLFEVVERPVPRSEVPGEESWPTQPIPTRPPPYAQQRFTAAEVTTRTAAARAYALARLATMRTGNIYLPPGFQPSVVLPQFNGGTDWGGAAFDPETRMLYVNASNEAEWISMVRSQPDTDLTLNELGKLIYGSVCSACHGFNSPNNPAAPSFGTLKTVHERLTRAQVRELLETGRGQMPSFALFSEPEKRAVVAFLFNEGESKRVSTKDLVLGFSQGIPYVSTGHHDFRDPEGYPVNRPPWGALTAISLDAGTIDWQVPLGTYPQLEAEGLPPTGTFNMGGPLVTAGGLVFIGASMDERFHAYDKTTGELLWEFQMAAGGYATPAAYEVAGRQYVIIAAGGGGKPGTRPGDAYHCFALPRK